MAQTYSQVALDDEIEDDTAHLIQREGEPSSSGAHGDKGAPARVPIGKGKGDIALLGALCTSVFFSGALGASCTSDSFPVCIARLCGSQWSVGVQVFAVGTHRAIGHMGSSATATLRFAAVTACTYGTVWGESAQSLVQSFYCDCLCPFLQLLCSRRFYHRS